MEKYYVTVENNGDTRWYKDEACSIRHREDGPAVELANGDKWWWLNGRVHREDGPAVELANGRREWHIKGNQLTEREFKTRDIPAARTNPACIDKPITIDGVNYKLTPV